MSLEIDFANLTQLSNNLPQLVSLDYLDIVRIQGEDAESFLQGQFSNDISQINPYEAQLNAYCTPKGRALAIFQLLKSDNSYLLIVPSDIVEGLVKRLQMFIMRAKVKLTILDKSTYLGLIGSGQESSQFSGKPFSLGGVLPRKLIVCEEPEAFKELSSKSNPLSGEAWKLIDIHSGIPQVYSNTLETFIPQNVNLELINGVSFKKGCYPGQEIVARLKYLGKSKQRLGISRIMDTDIINPGDEIYSEERPDQKSGLVIDAVEISERNFMASVMIPAANLNQEKLHLGSVTGPQLTALSLPYAIPNEQASKNKA